MISLIVATDYFNGIGKDGKMPWNLPNELKHFRNVTMGHTVVMGYNTYLALPNKSPLEGRRNIIFTSKDNLNIDGFETTYSKEYILELSKNEEVFVIGGAMLYALFFDDAEKLYITHIMGGFDCDKFFPKYEKRFFNIISYSGFMTDNDIPYFFEERTSKIEGYQIDLSERHPLINKIRNTLKENAPLFNSDELFSIKAYVDNIVSRKNEKCS